MIAEHWVRTWEETLKSISPEELWAGILRFKGIVEGKGLENWGRWLVEIWEMKSSRCGNCILLWVSSSWGPSGQLASIGSLRLAGTSGVLRTSWHECFHWYAGTERISQREKLTFYNVQAVTFRAVKGTLILWQSLHNSGAIGTEQLWGSRSESMLT